MTIESVCDKAGMHSPLLDSHIERLIAAVKHCNAPILDLGCGTGRNGLFLASQGLPVVFADRNEDALATIKPSLPDNSNTWLVDLEVPDSNPLSGQQYGAVIVYRYLHRPLFDAIKQAVKPGGLVIYETFTVAQAKLGRPKNPDFLLRPGELIEVFADWQVIHQFEGIANGSAIAQIVANRQKLI
jgi:SAM-dependent methyltransferase